jgi:exodeoxyribonuclease VII large subunit
VRHYDFRRSLAITRTKLDAGASTLQRAMQARLAHERARLEQLSARLNALSPVKILDRGYALVFDEEGRLVKDATQLSIGDRISARVSRGTLVAEVKETKAE